MLVVRHEYEFGCTVAVDKLCARAAVGDDKQLRVDDRHAHAPVLVMFLSVAGEKERKNKRRDQRERGYYRSSSYTFHCG